MQKFCRAGQATDDDMALAHCVLDTQDYKHFLGMRNNNNNNNNIYLLHLGCHPVAVVILHVNKT